MQHDAKCKKQGLTAETLSSGAHDHLVCKRPTHPGHAEELDKIMGHTAVPGGSPGGGIERKQLGCRAELRGRRSTGINATAALQVVRYVKGRHAVLEVVLPNSSDPSRTSKHKGLARST